MLAYRFIFTSRPDAACNGIQGILARAFASAEDGVSGAVKFVQPDELRQADGSTHAAAGRVMVLETVERECVHPYDLAIVLKTAVSSQLLALYKAYDTVFDRSLHIKSEGTIGLLNVSDAMSCICC